MSGFLNELRRRNVFRVAMVYLAVAWLCVQIVETILPAFGYGDAAVRWVVTGFAVGFVPALVFAWMYEITPEGLKQERHVDRSASMRAATGRKLDRVILVVLAIAVAYFMLDRFLLAPSRLDEARSQAHEAGLREATEQSEARFGRQSIVVLPFVDASDAQDQAWFAHGLSEELLNLLARVPELRVISRTSAAAFENSGQTVTEIAEALNVRHVLEGSVAAEGQRMRVIVQLIDAREDRHLWSERYERDLAGVFDVQADIAAAVVNEINPVLVGGLPAPRRADPEAYQLYLQSREIDEVTAESMSRAIAQVQAALSIDPDYAPAWRELGNLYFVERVNGLRPHDEALALAESALDKALALDPQDAEAHAVKGSIANVENDLALAASWLQTALRLEPRNTRVLDRSGRLLVTLGRHEEANAIYRFLASRDPVNVGLHLETWIPLIMSGQAEQAEAALRRALFLYPEHALARTLLPVTMALGGKYQEALELLQDPFYPRDGGIADMGRAMIYHRLGREEDLGALIERVASLPEAQQNGLDWAHIYAASENAAQTLHWLGIVANENEPTTVWWSQELHWPIYDFLENDSRFQALKAEVGVSPEHLDSIRFQVPPLEQT